MSVKELAINAMFMAIIITMAVVPNIGIITVGPISITLMHVPVIVAGIAFGLRSSLITSLTFGFSTMFVAMTRSVTPIDMLFANPVISVLPRFLFGLSIALIWKLLKAVKLQLHMSIALTAFLSTILHSIFVLGILFFFFGFDGSVFSQLSQWLKVLVIPVILNILVEAITAILLAVPLVEMFWRIEPQAKIKVMK